MKNPVYAEKGITFAEEFMATFPKQGADWFWSLRHSLSEMLCCASRQDDGEKVALSLIEEAPSIRRSQERTPAAAEQQKAPYA